jgi:hypothetical protein
MSAILPFRHLTSALAPESSGVLCLASGLAESGFPYLDSFPPHFKLRLPSQP